MCFKIFLIIFFLVAKEEYKNESKLSQGIYSWHLTLQLPILLLRTCVCRISFNRLKRLKICAQLLYFPLSLSSSKPFLLITPYCSLSEQYLFTNLFPVNLFDQSTIIEDLSCFLFLVLQINLVIFPFLASGAQ